MSFDNSNQAILKKVTSDNPKAPMLRLELTVDGVKYKAGLWPWTRKDGSPVLDRDGNQQYKGAVERDTYGEQVQQQGLEQVRQAAEAPPFEDESIPF